MLVELFIFFEIVVIGLFIASFFTKQEILWIIMIIISGTLMFTSYNIETYVYAINATSGTYEATSVSYSYPYLMAINLIFFGLGILLMIFDIFDKYGRKIIKKE